MEVKSFPGFNFRVILLVLMILMDQQEIKELRARAGMTQESLAHELGVSVSTVQKWEGGWSRPRGLSLRALENLAQKISPATPPSLPLARGEQKIRAGRTAKK